MQGAYLAQVVVQIVVVASVNTEKALTSYNLSFGMPSPPSRRRLLHLGVASGSLLLAGCTVSLFQSEEGKESNRKRVTIDAIDDVPSEADVEFSIEVVREEITSRSTARLRTVMRNSGENEQKIKLPYYKGASSSAGAAGILLYSVTAPDGPSPDSSPECLTQPKKAKTGGELVWTTEGVPTPKLSPGESHTEQIVVDDDWTYRGCFPVGTYRFESRHMVDGVKFTWGFTLQVSEMKE